MWFTWVHMQCVCVYEHVRTHMGSLRGEPQVLFTLFETQSLSGT